MTVGLVGLSGRRNDLVQDHCPIASEIQSYLFWQHLKDETQLKMAGNGHGAAASAGGLIADKRRLCEHGLESERTIGTRRAIN
jgi:hypothetical protein